eukprot:7266593-Alexandrium_andersonii.AAC.1
MRGSEDCGLDPPVNRHPRSPLSQADSDSARERCRVHRSRAWGTIVQVALCPRRSGSARLKCCSAFALSLIHISEPTRLALI